MAKCVTNSKRVRSREVRSGDLISSVEAARLLKVSRWSMWRFLSGQPGLCTVIQPQNRRYVARRDLVKIAKLMGVVYVQPAA